MAKVDLLSEIEGLVTDLRDSNLTQISKLTKELIMADNWGDEDMLMLKLVYKMIDTLDLRLHYYEVWLRETQEKIDNEN